MFVHGFLALVITFNLIDSSINFDESKLLNTNYRVHKDEKDEKEGKRCHSWHRADESLEDNLQLLCFLY